MYVQLVKYSKFSQSKENLGKNGISGFIILFLLWVDLDRKEMLQIIVMLLSFHFKQLIFLFPYLST